MDYKPSFCLSFTNGENDCEITIHHDHDDLFKTSGLVGITFRRGDVGLIIETLCYMAGNDKEVHMSVSLPTVPELCRNNESYVMVDMDTEMDIYHDVDDRVEHFSERLLSWIDMITYGLT